jgi:hypothetical protein
MAYLLKTITVEPEKQPSLGNGYVTRSSVLTWKRCFPYGPCRGYITRASCHYERVLRWQLEK